MILIGIVIPSNLEALILFSPHIALAEPSIKSWKEMVRVDILTLFLILGGYHSVFHHQVWYQL